VPRTEFEIKGKIFIWDGSRFYSASGEEPQLETRGALNLLLDREFKARTVFGADERLHFINSLRTATQYDLAEQHIREVMEKDPGRSDTRSTLCSILRSMGQPQRALDETAKFAAKGNPPLLTSRAAAMCDLERFEDAKKEVGRVLAIQKKIGDEAGAVVSRIKRARPDLYKK